MAVDWSRGITVNYYAMILDPVTLLDQERFEIKDSSVKKDSSDLRESADLTCVDRWKRPGEDESDSPGRLQYSFGQGVERWVRIYVDARQEDAASHVAVFTGIASAPTMDIKGRQFSNTVQCYSVLKPANDIMLPIGWSVQKGVNGADIIKELLSVGPAPIEILGESDSLSSTIVAEGGETHLTMVDKILKAINWRLVISGDGTIYLGPKASSANEKYFSSTYNDVVELTVQVENNWFDCPNVFRAMNDELIAVARDEDPDSIYSIPSRGREIWMEEDGVNLSEEETIGAYAERRLKEEQKINYTLSYDRRFDPDILPTDLVQISYPEQEINDIFEIVSQTIRLGNGVKVSEEVKLWEQS